MKTILSLALSLLFMVSFALATEESDNLSFSYCTSQNLFFSLTMQEGQSGCCSWHDGVCGCDPSGRVICCDNTLSPSCRC